MKVTYGNISQLHEYAYLVWGHMTTTLMVTEDYKGTTCYYGKQETRLYRFYGNSEILM